MKPKSMVFLITRNGMGETEDQALRITLIRTFLRLLNESGNLPAAICFYSDGVRLACVGSEVLDDLRTLEGHGVRLVLCQTCLKQFGLLDEVQVGIVGGMGDILTAMQNADSVVTI